MRDKDIIDLVDTFLKSLEDLFVLNPNSINVGSIDIGVVPSQRRFYITSQTGTIKMNLPNYEPEEIDNE